MQQCMLFQQSTILFKDGCRSTHNRGSCYVFSLPQELRTREEELMRQTIEQQVHARVLRQREQELAEREIDLLGRELNIMILQQQQDEKPVPKKRRNKFRRGKVRRSNKRISGPSGE